MIMAEQFHTPSYDTEVMLGGGFSKDEGTYADTCPVDTEESTPEVPNAEEREQLLTQLQGFLDLSAQVDENVQKVQRRLEAMNKPNQPRRQVSYMEDRHRHQPHLFQDKEEELADVRRRLSYRDTEEQAARGRPFRVEEVSTIPPRSMNRFEDVSPMSMNRMDIHDASRSERHQRLTSTEVAVPPVDRNIYRQPHAQQREQLPRRFDGCSSIEGHMLMFNNCATLNGWSKDTLGYHLFNSLHHTVVDKIIHLIDERDAYNYDTLVRALYDRYGTKGKEGIYLSMLNARTRKDKEPLRDLYDDLTQLVYRALPKADRSTRDYMLLNSLQKAIPDVELQSALATNNPKSPEEAIQFLMMYEAKMASVKGVGQVNNWRPKQQIRQVGGYEGLYEESHQADQAQAAEKTVATEKITDLQEIRDMFKALMDQNKRNKRLPLEKIKCYKCHQYGHYKRRCPQNDNQNEEQPEN